MNKSFRYFNKLILILMVVFALYSIACQSILPKNSEVAGLVTDVRITNQVEIKTKSADRSSDAALGAIVGGLITGGIGGAAIGAAINTGDGSQDIQYVVEPIACKLFVSLPEIGNIEFYPGWSAEIPACTLFRKGDKIIVTKRTRNKKTSYILLFNDIEEIGKIIN